MQVNEVVGALSWSQASRYILGNTGIIITTSSVILIHYPGMHIYNNTILLMSDHKDYKDSYILNCMDKLHG